jgi:ATP-dependent protease ClpP protease subunit
MADVRRDGFSIKAAGPGEAEISLYEEIDPHFGVSAKRFRDELKALGAVTTIRLCINSPGGAVFEGLAIYNLLKTHPARVLARIDGMALSMASVVAMAADEIEAPANAFLMIHNPVNLVVGDGDDLRHTADLLDKLRDQLAGIYAQRSKQPIDKILGLMDAETWMSGEEASQLGFVDRITNDVAVAARLDPRRYGNVPERFLQQITSTNQGADAMADDFRNTPVDPNAGAPEPKPVAKSPIEKPPADTAAALADFRAAHADETRRIAGIRAITGKYPGDHSELEAKAIADGWPAEKAELAVLRESRPVGPAFHAGPHAPDAKVLECAMLMAVMHPEKNLLARFGQPVVERAERFRRVRFNQLIDLCCSMEGRPVPGIGATQAELIRAGFSTVSLPGILSNVGHKVMLQAYTDAPTLVDRLCKRLTASDFKTHTGYRLSSDMKLEQVAADGQLSHGKLSEASYPFSVDTYGKIFGLTRQMQINDDLGAFAEVPRLIGRGAALTKERLFWSLVHDNTGTFFGSTNANSITTALGSAGLKAAVRKLEEQTDSEGDPILILAMYLVVPPALKEDAKVLFASDYVNTGGAAPTEKVPSRNIYQNAYEPLSSPYISNTSFHASATATQWYLWGNPADVAAFGVAYLNGQDSPVVEDAPLAGDILGNAWRGYLDVGVCQIDHRAAVKSTGGG